MGVCVCVCVTVSLLSPWCYLECVLYKSLFLLTYLRTTSVRNVAVRMYVVTDVFGTGWCPRPSIIHCDFFAFEN